MVMYIFSPKGVLLGSTGYGSKDARALLQSVELGSWCFIPPYAWLKAVPSGARRTATHPNFWTQIHIQDVPENIKALSLLIV